MKKLLLLCLLFVVAVTVFCDDAIPCASLTTVGMVDVIQMGKADWLAMDSEQRGVFVVAFYYAFYWSNMIFLGYDADGLYKLTLYDIEAAIVFATAWYESIESDLHIPLYQVLSIAAVEAVAAKY